MKTESQRLKDAVIKLQSILRPKYSSGHIIFYSWNRSPDFVLSIGNDYIDDKEVHAFGSIDELEDYVNSLRSGVDREILFRKFKLNG